MPDASPTGFLVLIAGFSKDQQNVFFNTKKIPGAEAASFDVMEQDAMKTQEFYFARDKSHIYFKDKRLLSPDLVSFKIAGLGYAFDKSRVYYKERIVNGADSKTFTVYEHGFGEADSKDANNEYLEGRVVKK